MDKIYKYIIGFGVITLVSIVLSFIALFKRGPTGAKGDSGDKGDIGASGKPGIQGPPGPAGIMTVQCSSDSGNGTSCKAKIPNELVVDGLTVENTLQVGTSTAYRWDNDGIQLGSSSNRWSQRGDLTTSGDIKTSGDLVVDGPTGISLQQGNMVIESPAAYLALGAPTSANSAPHPPYKFYWDNSGIQNGSGGGNFWTVGGNIKTSGNITSNTIQTSGDLIVGSPSNKITSSPSSSSHIYNLEIGRGFSATGASATFYDVVAQGDGGYGGTITASGDIKTTSGNMSAGKVSASGQITGDMLVSSSGTWQGVQSGGTGGGSCYLPTTC